MTYRILSFDGGGIRGLMSAILLQNLVNDHPTMLDNTDLFVGTSTGGLIALCLASDGSATELVDIYTNQGSNIFDRYEPLPGDDLGPGIFSAFYKNDYLIELAGTLFPGLALSQLARSNGPKSVAVCTTQLWDADALEPGKGSWMPRLFSNLPGSDFSGLSAVDAALSTSAAPGYFPPYLIGIDDDDLGGYYIDGGLTANDPTLMAIEAVVSSGAAALEDIVVLSFGTGVSSYGIMPSQVGDPQSWGMDYWIDPIKSGVDPACPILELALAMNQQSAQNGAYLLLGNNLCRVQPTIDPYPMDDWRHIATLQADAQNYINSVPARWQLIDQFVGQYWDNPS